MEQNNQMRTGFAAEVKLIPPWLLALAAAIFVLAQIIFDVLIGRQADAPPVWARILLGLLLGLVLSCYLMLIGYINRDARRRAMSSALWTIVAIFIPNGLGIILYFILRQPRTGTAPANESYALAGTSCPRCGYNLKPSCTACGQAVGMGDLYCRHCGTSLQTPAVKG